MSKERIIGVDFGTSTSVIRVKRYNNGQPVDDRLSKQEVIFNGDKPMVPTVIQQTDKGAYYGYDALIHKKEEILFQNFKVNLENPDPVRRQEARALTEEFFVYMAKEYRSQSESGYFGDPNDIERTIVSYPVKWRDETKTFLIKTAEKVGFKNVEGMDEAQAAIHAVIVQSGDYLIKHGFFRIGVPCNILLIDMGAGTTDLALCRHTPGDHPKNEIICTWPKAGDVLFGGREVDEILRKYIHSLLPEDQADTVLKKNGIKEFKIWKETTVSPALARCETVEEFSSIDNIVDILDIDMEPYNLDRSRFEKLTEKYLEEFPRLIAGCIDNSNIRKEEVDLVILTGGHSQWYFVKEMLTDGTKVDLPKIRQNPDRVVPIIRPQETVALGMIYRPLSVEFWKCIVEYEYNYYKKRYEEERKKYIVEYNRNYCTFRGALVAKFEYGWIIVKPDGTIEGDETRGWIRGVTDKSWMQSWKDIVSIFYNDSWMFSYIVGLRKDGTVVAVGNNIWGECDVQGWKDIISIFCGRESVRVRNYFGGAYTVGLRKDGTVVATGSNRCGQCNVQGWKNIASIFGGIHYTVGLRKNGTVVAVGYNNCGQCNVQGWKDIVSIFCGSAHTVGLRKDGTVVATGSNEYGECNVQGWKDIVSISGGRYHTVGLRKDGTVVATGSNKYGECNVQGWKDIISISYDFIGDNTVGLRKDGTVIATGNNEYGQCNVQGWKDIMAVGAVWDATFGIKSDGTIIYTDYKKYETLLDKILGTYTVDLLGTKTLPWKLF